jgi:hypothetical protein
VGINEAYQGRQHRFVYGYASVFADPQIGIAKVGVRRHASAAEHVCVWLYLWLWGCVGVGGDAGRAGCRGGVSWSAGLQKDRSSALLLLLLLLLLFLPLLLLRLRLMRCAPGRRVAG